MREAIKVFLRYLHGIITVVTFLILLSYPVSMFGTPYETALLSSMSVLIPFMVTGVAAEKVKNIFLYLVLAIGSLAAPVLLNSDIAGKVIFTLISIIIIILRIADRVNGNMGILVFPRLGMLIYFVIAYLISLGMNIELGSYIIIRLTYVYLILLMVFENLYRLDNYFEVNQEVANIPRKQILRTNDFLLLGFVVVAGLLMFLFPKIGVDQLIRNFFLSLRDLFWAIIEKLPKKDPTEPTQASLTPVMTQVEGDGMGMLDTPDAPLWLTAFYNGLTVVIFAATGGLMLFLLAKGIFNVIRRFYRSFSENGDEEEFLSDKKDLKEAAMETSFIKRPEWLDFSPNATIRRIYKKTVERQSQKVTTRSMTPQEIEDYVGLKPDETRERLHLLYEKARYSKKGCDKEDVRKLRGRN